LRAALTKLKARRIYVPPLDKKYLDRGHACHFRCYAEGVEGLRVDILAKLRGCDDFSSLWDRRFEVKIPSGPQINVISLRDLVISKKTQRDKDWFMLRRLVDNDIALHSSTSSRHKIDWWLCECRNPSYLLDLCRKYRDLARQQLLNRSLLKAAIRADQRKLTKLLEGEKQKEQERDKAYWTLLKKELELLRHKTSSRRLV
jgi:hypothetical protein